MEDLRSFVELLVMLASDPRQSVLIALLVIAAISDYRSYRIPNWLTLGGIVFAVVYRSFSARTPVSGFLDASGGFLIGFGIMLPFYVMRVMGAGDVKLMAMVGAFLGIQDTLYAVLCTFIVGGVAAIGLALLKKTFVRMLINVRNVVQSMLVAASFGVKPDAQVSMVGQSIGRLPYGVSIGVGTIGFVFARQFGYA